LSKAALPQKYFDEFLAQKDVYLFLGTTKQYHNVSPNLFVIIGVFYPPKPKITDSENAQQLSLFWDDAAEQGIRKEKRF